MNLKNQKKLQTREDFRANLPDTWEEFISLLKIRSGENYKQFIAYDYQSKLIGLCEKESTILIIKSRQLGITQTIASYFLFKACKNPAYSAICFSRTQDDVSALSRRVRDMALQLQQYGIELLIDNVGLIKLKNLGEIYFKNSAKEGSRSYDSVSDFLFDEAAFVPTIESIYSASSASSSMVSKSLKVIVSTPGSKLNWFYKQANLNSEEPIDTICNNVVNGLLPPFYSLKEGGLNKIFIHWKVHPIYSKREDYLEYRKEQDQTSIEVINREYNLTFEEIEEHGIFNSKIIQNSSIEQTLESPLKGFEYFIGIDTATIGNDYFVATIFQWDKKKFKQIYLYQDRINRKSC
ncbi:terminase large subunit domain-containing protein [Planktothrix tepida]|nr:terminase family protein [Planktothrix tepida]